MEVIDFVFVTTVISIVLYYLVRNLTCLFVLTLASIGYIYLKRTLKQRQSYIKGNGQAVIITGCDTGIGHATALRLHELGFTVFAGCLNSRGHGAVILRKHGSKRLHVLSLDVTDDKSVDEALTHVTKNCTERGVLAVVNNAGINIMADIELASLDFYRRVADVNIYGMIRVTKAFCPLVRKYKGRFVNVTSVKGRLAGPLDSTYTITKWAGEAFSDILRREMGRFGVKVVIMEPGDFGGLTGMLSQQTLKRMETDLNTAWDNATPEVKEAYGRQYIDSLITGINGAGKTCAENLDPVVNAMQNAITSTNPKYRYLVDGSCQTLDKYCVFARLNPYIPEAFMDILLPWFFPLPDIKYKSQ